MSNSKPRFRKNRCPKTLLKCLNNQTTRGGWTKKNKRLQAMDTFTSGQLQRP